MGRGRDLSWGSGVSFRNSHQPLFFLCRCPEAKKNNLKIVGRPDRDKTLGQLVEEGADIAKSGSAKPFSF